MERREYLRTPRYRVSVARDRDHPEQLVARLTKSWWGGPGVGGLSKTLGEQWVDVTGMGQEEAMSAVLMDLSLSMRAGLYQL